MLGKWAKILAELSRFAAPNSRSSESTDASSGSRASKNDIRPETMPIKEKKGEFREILFLLYSMEKKLSPWTKSEDADKAKSVQR